MESTTIIEKLMTFGLSRQEATIYLCLLQNGNMNGYEVSKETGISRSNVYSSLVSLTDKGAANLIEGNPSKYVAVSIEELCENYIHTLAQNMEFLKEEVAPKQEAEVGYVTISGYQNIMNKLRHMMEETKERIYISVSGEILAQITKELEKCSERGLRIVIISDIPDVQKPKLQCEYYFKEDKSTQLRFISDSHYVLTGELTGKESDSGLYCGQKNFVAVFKDALRNEIKLIQLNQ